MLDMQLSLADELARRRVEPCEDLLTMLVLAANEANASADPAEPSEPVGVPELVSMTASS